MHELDQINKFSFARLLRYQIYDRKLKSPLGVILLTLIAGLIGYLDVAVDYRASFGLAALFMAVFFLIIFMRYPYFALYLTIAFSALPSLLSRIFMDTSVKIEFSNIVDIFTILLFISISTKPQIMYANPDGRKFYGNPITTTFIILLMFYLSKH